MKKIFVLFTFMSVVSFAVNAQNCSHAKTGVTAVTQEQENYAKTVAAAAAIDESIEKKVCSKSGNVSYERKNVCSTSGKVSFTSVEYDAASKKFVNVSPSGASTGKKANCAAKCAKTCTKAKSSTSTSNEDVKVRRVSNVEN